MRSCITRKSTFSINYATNSKKEYLDKIFYEYKRLVNLYIDRFWQNKKLVTLLRKEFIECETWLSTRLMKQASKQAVQIIKGCRDKELKRKRKKYNKLYHKCITKGVHPQFTNKHFHELHFVYKSKPEYTAESIPLDSRFLDIQFDNNSFDMWFRLKSLTTKVNLIKLPSRKYTYFNNKIKEGYAIKESGRLWKKGNQYFIDIILEKDKPEIKETGEVIGIDIGLNKLVTTSDNNMYGKGLKPLLDKLSNRVANSHNHKQTILEIKHYINSTVNKIDFNKYNVIVLEDIKNIEKNTKHNSDPKKRRAKKTRKYLSHWNRKLLVGRIGQRSEENGVFVALVDPAYTSQTCSRCDNVDKANRDSEFYSCQCGLIIDADYNAAINIKRRFDREATVPYLTKT